MVIFLFVSRDRLLLVLVWISDLWRQYVWPPQSTRTRMRRRRRRKKKRKKKKRSRGDDEEKVMVMVEVGGVTEKRKIRKGKVYDGEEIETTI